MKMELNKFHMGMELKVHIFGTIVYYYSDSIEGIIEEFNKDYRRVCQWYNRTMRRTEKERSSVEKSGAIIAYSTMTEAKKMLEMMPF